MTALTYIQGGDGERRVWRRRLGDGESRSSITILNGRARSHWIRDVEGAFSIKWVPTGRAIYRVDRASHLLGGRHAVILNQDQPYELEFLDRTGTETLCVFVSDDLVAGAWAELAGGDGEGSIERSRIPAFPDMVFRPDPRLARDLQRLRETYASDDPSDLATEEKLLGLVSRLVAAAQGHRRLSERLPAAKPSTRRLLVGRVERVRELLEDSAETPSLDVLARQGALSKFHLLRLFKAAYGCTPSAYAAARKMARAKRLLAATSMSVTAIGEALGYESVGAFVRAFRRHFGVAPSAIRV